MMAITFDKPESVTYWQWSHWSVIDMPLWQNCIVAADLAKVDDVVGVADKMYVHNGGAYKQPKRRRK